MLGFLSWVALVLETATMYRGPVVSAARSSVGFRVLCFALYGLLSLWFILCLKACV